MKSTTLGQLLRVSALGLGCMGMSQSYGPNPGDRDEMIAVLRSAASHSSTPPRSTVLTPTRNLSVRRCSRCAQVVIATKFGWDISEGRSVGLSRHDAAYRSWISMSLTRHLPSLPKVDSREGGFACVLPKLFRSAADGGHQVAAVLDTRARTCRPNGRSKTPATAAAAVG